MHAYFEACLSVLPAPQGNTANIQTENTLYPKPFRLSTRAYIPDQILATSPLRSMSHIGTIRPKMIRIYPTLAKWPSGGTLLWLSGFFGPVSGPYFG